MALAETPGSQIEVLNRAEKMGVLESTERWLEARKLRDSLVHEYMEDGEIFLQNILLAREFTELLVDCYNRIRDFAVERMSIDVSRVPQKIGLTV